MVVFGIVGGGVAPVAADPPPQPTPLTKAAWWDDLVAAGKGPGAHYQSPAAKPARSAPVIQSTPLKVADAAVKLPQPGVAEVTLADRGVASRAGSSPVRLSATTAASVGADVRVEVLDQKAAERVGVHGFAFRLSGAGGAALEAGTKLPATLSLDYGSFADLFGGDYAGRLRVVTMQACAVADPVPRH